MTEFILVVLFFGVLVGLIGSGEKKKKYYKKSKKTYHYKSGSASSYERYRKNFKNHYPSSQRKAQDTPLTCYRKKPFLMNVPERKFYEGLIQIVPNGCIVLPQVVMSSIFDLEKSQKYNKGMRSKIDKKTIDFVIFKMPYFTPLLGIEYDGKTHLQKDRKERDQFVDNVFHSCGINIIHIPHRQDIDYLFVKKEIESNLS